MARLRHSDRCKIPDRFTMIPVGGGEFRLHSLSSSIALQDRDGGILSELLPLLREEIAVADLLARLSAFDEQAVLETLERLLETGALERVDSEESGRLPAAEASRLRAQIAFLSHFVAPPDEQLDGAGEPLARTGGDYQVRLKESRVAVFGAGRIGSQVVRALVLAGVGRIAAVDGGLVGRQALDTDGWFGPDDAGLSRAEAVRRSAVMLRPDVEMIAVDDDPSATEELLESATFAVLCPDHFEPAEYDAFNKAALATRTPWTSGRLAGFEFHIGPTVVPFETACYTCFDLRRKSNLPDVSEYRVLESFLNQSRLSEDSLAFTPAPSLLALEILKALAWFTAPATWGRLYSFNLLTLEARLHPVLKLPRCPACGRPAQARPTVHAWQQRSVGTAR